MDDAVWVSTVFTKNRERLIAHDAVIALFNHVLEVADKQDWLSGEHFSVNGTLIQAWAGHKSFVSKDGSDEPGGGASFKGQTRCNETHESPSTRHHARGFHLALFRFAELHYTNIAYDTIFDTLTKDQAMENTTVLPAASPDRTFAVLAHVGGLFTSWVAPLVIFLIKKSDKSASFSTANAKEALNFQITLFIVFMILMFSFVGIFLLFIPMIFNLIVSIMAAVKASNGVSFRYPLALRLIK